MFTICPVCKKDDVIQKVSAVVTSGQSSGSFSGPSGGIAYVGGKWGAVSGYTTLSGRTVSELAQQLSKLQIKPPSAFAWWMLFPGVLALAVTAGFLADPGGGIGILVLAILFWSGGVDSLFSEKNQRGRKICC